MARLTAFKMNSQLVEAGAWISPGEEYDDLLILTRGYNDSYYDAQAQKLRRAALSYNGDAAKVPNAVSKAIRTECIISHLLLDVKNLTDENGNPVDIVRFRDMLRDPDYSQLVVACMTAAGLVGRQVAQDKADASGNSATPSA